MRYKIDFSYDGSLFFGYQKQPNKRTIQGEIERVLSSINDSPVTISSSGRTDRGVNALHQIAHFDFNKDISCFKLKGALNSYLPDDIYINEVSKVDDDFHARYSAKRKTYSYFINMGTYNPMKRSQAFQYCKKLDVNLMKEASKYMLGKHDFTTFACGEDRRSDKVREIYKIDFNLSEDVLTISFTGSGFLKYQVRNMVGLLIKVGEKKESPENVGKLIEQKDRKKIGITAPACGLTLINVEY